MRSTTSLAAIAFLATSVYSMPNIRARTTDGLTPWVTVDDSGTASTVTPYVTTVDGVTSTVSAAPNDITGTVFTQTSYGKITTSTGSAPIATATATDGAGSFAVCNNKDGTDAPWCSPDDGSNLYPGTTYYFVWDSSYFTANTTVQIQGNYFNQTTGETTTQAFQSDKMVASWGFWALTVDSSLMQGKSGVNISVAITAVNTTSSTSSKSYKGPTILVTKTPTYHAPAAQLPNGAALYIGLPVIFGFVIICLFGTCLWNKKQRRITLGNVMSRTRHGHGLGKAPARGLTKRQKEQKAAERVQLMEREVVAGGGQVYRDEPNPRYSDLPRRDSDLPRRDSDALGSLAGTPVEDKSMEFQQSGTRDGRERVADGERNYFRDEMRRQEQDRL